MSVKFAIVGCGAIGSRHAAVIDAEARGSIVTFCDTVSEKARLLSEKYGNDITCYTDYDEMLASTDATVVNICTPHGLHAEMAIKAANAGKHILVEKPMALTVADSMAMIKAAEENSVHLMVVKQNRFNVPIALTKQAIDSGKLGRVFMAQCDVLWNRHDGYYAESNWRGSKTLEGGALYTQASHFIDLLNWWFGDVVAVQAEIATRNHSIEIEDCGNALLTFDSGVMGSLTWTTCVYNKNYEGSITIIAENGTIKIGGPYLNKIEYWDVKAMPLQDDIIFVDKPNAYGKYQGTSSNHDKVVANVVSKLLNERHHVVEGDEGIMSIRAIEMIYKHARMV
ncbi:Gfo/Idh/MocA family protein [Geobacter sp. DSM 9736]|uniref:Gfo/Idh/MocA family protein n=1 Tax=Geobacter sp. DSM 9736 TaxID=1277350 RepID=UPI000B4FEF8C|nr:Gfo/Idh/MocA family oxidoreductase [Geobacter sp. DSM 9736]SNB45052.1 Predicted dehydrogenase [Geobacter sp. DSM 9736]